MPELNTKFQSARNARGWTIRYVATRLDVSLGIVSYWEKGRSSPLPELRPQLCELFGMSIAELGFIEIEDEGKVSVRRRNEE